MESSRRSPLSTMCTLSWTLERRWFFQFFVGIFLCLCNGAVFCFGVFSPFLKKEPFRFSQSELNWISTVGFSMSYFSLPAGFLYDYKGPALTLLVGTTVNAVGWLGMFLLFVNGEKPLLGTNAVTMCVFYAFSQLSACFYETGSVLTNLEAFSCYQGRVVLIQKTFIGLGSSVIVQIYIAFFETRFESIAPYFVFLLAFSLCSGILGTIFVRLPTEETRCVGLNVVDEEMAEKGRGESTLFRVPFNIGTGVLIASLIYLSGATLLENEYTLSNNARIAVGVCTLLLCAAFSLMFLFTPNYSLISSHDETSGFQEEITNGRFEPDATETREIIGREPSAANDKSHSGEEKIDLLIDVDSDRSEKARGLGLSDDDKPADAERCSANECSIQRSSVDEVLDLSADEVILNSKSLWRNIRKLDLWIMWSICFTSWGAAALVSTNSAQIYESLDFAGFSSTVNVVFVSTYGIANAVGRALAGAVHPFLVRRKTSVTVLYTVGPLINTAGLLIFLFVPPKALVLPYFLVGLSTGISWASTLLIVKELFTSNNCGKHYSALYTAGILSSLLFNIGLFGPVYDHYSKKQGLWDTRQCEGRSCVLIPLTVCAILNFFSFPLSIYFMKRIKRRRGIL